MDALFQTQRSVLESGRCHSTALPGRSPSDLEERRLELLFCFLIWGKMTTALTQCIYRATSRLHLDGHPAQVTAATCTCFARSGLIASGDVRLLLITEPLLGRKKKKSSNCFKKAARVHQIKLLHTTLSKSIIWEIPEME